MLSEKLLLHDIPIKRVRFILKDSILKCSDGDINLFNKLIIVDSGCVSRTSSRVSEIM